MIIMILFNNDLCMNCTYKGRILLVVTLTKAVTFSRKFSAKFNL